MLFDFLGETYSMERWSGHLLTTVMIYHRLPNAGVLQLDKRTCWFVDREPGEAVP